MWGVVFWGAGCGLGYALPPQAQVMTWLCMCVCVCVCVCVTTADIASFTSMSNELAPSRVMTFLNDLFTQFDELVEEHGIYKVRVFNTHTHARTHTRTL